VRQAQPPVTDQIRSGENMFGGQRNAQVTGPFPQRCWPKTSTMFRALAFRLVLFRFAAYACNQGAKLGLAQGVITGALICRSASSGSRIGA